MHENSLELFKKYALPYFKDNMEVLEVGPDGYPSSYCNIIQGVNWTYGDLYQKDASDYIWFKEEYTPDTDRKFDLILSGQVIEHVRKPWRWVQALANLLKPNGYLILINPVSWPYHEAPVDCWRIYPEGIKALFDDAGLQCVMSIYEGLVGQHCCAGNKVIDTFSVGQKINKA
jgi:SAM-dependent methyltransferase